MRIVLIVPDGVVIRNYLYSNFVKELEKKNFEVHIIHQIPNAAVKEIKNCNPSIKHFTFIDFFTEDFLARTIRETTVYARILYNIKAFNNHTIRFFWNDNRKGIKRIFLYSFSKFFGFLLSKFYGLILFFENFYDKLILKQFTSNSVLKKIIDIQPHLVLNLHQRSILASPIIAFCKKNNIKTATTIFSWDNIPKARLISRYDYYFLWSNLMKDEMKIAYPEIPERKLIVTGTPQFEFYFRDEFKETKEDFFNKYNLSISKKTICFSSNDTSSPYDHVYLNDICEELSKLSSDEIPQIIFRINPFDKSNRFNNVLSKYSHLITVINPDYRSENENEKHFVNIYCSFDDIKILINTVLHSDLVINLGSTMAHDFAIYDKPCIYLNYDTEYKPFFNVKSVYNFQHFKSMDEMDAVVWINDKNEINEKITFALKNPNLVALDRKKWIKKIINHPLENNSFLLAQEIEKICTFAL